MRTILALSAAAVLLSGCAQQTFTINPGASSLKSEEMSMFFVAGIGQEKSIDAAAICGGANRVAKVEAQQDPVDVLINWFSSSIVSPRKARVYCLR